MSTEPTSAPRGSDPASSAPAAPAPDRVPSSPSSPEIPAGDPDPTRPRRRLLLIAGWAAVAIICIVAGIAYITQPSSPASSGLDYREVYTVDYQDQVAAGLDEKKEGHAYTEDDMLIEANPFGTNTTALYVYFTTDDPAQVSYCVSAPDAGCADFSATPAQEAASGTEHEFQVLGLIPDTRNQVVFTLAYADGSTKTRVYTCDGPSLLGNEDVQLEETARADDDAAVDAATASLGNGLYAILGNDSDDQDFMYYYDANGVLRGEIPIIGYRSHRLLFQDGLMYFSVSESKMAAMDGLGRVRAVYDLGRYDLHHDYAFDNDGNILILASDSKDSTVEDRIVKLDVATGEVTEVLDLGDLFGSYKEATEANNTEDDDEWDWMHINTIQWNEDGSAILSSRETSTIIKIDDLEGAPSIDYLIGDGSFWKGTGYEQYLLTKVGDFADTGGQHAVTVERDASLPSGQYYLYMFDNNFGLSTTMPDFDWASAVPGIQTTVQDGDKVDEGATSYYRKYLVDEAAGTYELVSSFEVPYSAYVSSVQEVGDLVVTDSGIRGLIGVYSEDGTLLRQFKSMLNDLYIYRTLYYDFDGFYFADAA